jgi:hypothetical protein
MTQKTSWRVDFLFRPGRFRPAAERAALVAELREVAATCFDEIPHYQCLEGPAALSDKVITVARRPDGRAVGFCSAIVLPVAGVGDVLHLGLTCVRPEARSGRLTTTLLSKLLIRYLVRHRGLRNTWCTNVACVLSSLGNVALHFDSVYPSPFGPARPTRTHLRIARAIAAHYRRPIHIDSAAVLDEEAFVFRGSVPGTVFQKDAADSRFFHRDRALNDYYQELMCFARGDEVIQVARVGLGTLGRYLGRSLPFTRGRRPRPAALARPA